MRHWTGRGKREMEFGDASLYRPAEVALWSGGGMFRWNYLIKSGEIRDSKYIPKSTFVGQSARARAAL